MSISATIKSVQDIMRQDAGVDGVHREYHSLCGCYS